MFICHSFSMRWPGPKFLNATYFLPQKKWGVVVLSLELPKAPKTGKIFDNSSCV